MRPILTALSVVVLLAGCGSSGDDNSTTAASTSSPSTTAAGTTATTATTPTFANGKTIKGTGYSFQLPSGWIDGSEPLKGSAIKFDVAYVDPATSNPTQNIIVIRETPSGGVKSSDLPEVNNTFRGQAATLADAKGVSPTSSSKLDGETADGYVYGMKSTTTGRQRQLFAVHDNAVYTITWTGSTKDFATKSSKLFDQVLATWQWK